MITWLGLCHFCEIVLHQKYLLLNPIPLAADVVVVSEVIVMFCLFPVVGLARLGDVINGEQTVVNFRLKDTVLTADNPLPGTFTGDLNTTLLLTGDIGDCNKMLDPVGFIDGSLVIGVDGSVTVEVFED